MREKLSKMRFINGVLWLAFVLAMAASIQHLAYTFGTVERPGWEFLGWIPAVAVDMGLAALAYTIQHRKRNNGSTTALWAGVVGFAAVSALANFYHALSVENVAVLTGSIVYIKAAVLSATLPVAYIFLGEIISSDDARVSAKAEQDEQRALAREERVQRRQERETENEAKRLEIEQQRLLLEQQHQQQAAQASNEAATHERTCSKCGTTFRNRQAYAAHACMRRTTAVLVAEQPAAQNGNGKH